jgi:hypothetical protein
MTGRKHARNDRIVIWKREAGVTWNKSFGSGTVTSKCLEVPEIMFVDIIIPKAVKGDQDNRRAAFLRL